MKKIATTKKEKDFYNVVTIIDDIAIIKSSISGKTALLNIKTNELIGILDYYNIKVDEFNKLYYQIKNAGEKKLVNIYDIINKKFLVYNFEIINSLILTFTKTIVVYLLKSPIDEKIHLFDVWKCRDKDNIFDKPLNNYSYLINEFKNTYYVLTDTNDKKNIYQVNNGFTAKFEYDDIEKKGDIVIYTKGEEKSFSMIYDDKISHNIIGKFKEIKYDKNERRLLQCKDDEYTYIYDLEIKSLILKKSRDFKCIALFSYYSPRGLQTYDYDYEYIFIETDRKTNKKSLISITYNQKERELRNKYLIKDYDAIHFDHYLKNNNGVALFLEKDKKLDLFLGNMRFNKYLKLESDKIEHLDEDYYVVAKDGCTNIIEANPKSSLKIVIKNCVIKDKGDCAIIYSQKNNEGKELEGIFYFEDSEYPGDIYRKNVPATYSKINRISHHLYLTEENTNKGMYCFGRLIIPTEFKDIDIAFSPKYPRIDIAWELYFSLKKENSNILAKRKMGYDIHSDNGNKLEIIGEYNDVIFLKDLIVLKISSSTIIYDYDMKLLGEFSINTTITSFNASKDEYNPKIIYCIDNDYYFYKDGNLEKYYKEDIDIYSTTYETNIDIFEAITYKKDILGSFTTYIDSMEDDNGEASLRELSKDNYELKNKYPSLVLKRKEVK